MYKSSTTITKIYRNKFSFEYNCFSTITENNKVLKFSTLSFKGEIVNEFNHSEVFDFFNLDKQRIIVTSSDGETSYLLNNNSIKKLDFSIVNAEYIDYKHFSAFTKKGKDLFYEIFDAQTLNTKLSILYTRGFWQPDVKNDRYIYWIDHNLFVYNMICELKWQLDVSKTHATDDVLFGKRSGEISTVIPYNEFLIVFAGTKMIKFQAEDGKLVDEVEIGFTISRNAIIYKNQLFYFGNAGYRIFCPDNFEQKSKITLQKQFYDGKELGLNATGFTFYNDILWFASHEYVNYVAGVNPFTGELKELLIMPVSNGAALDTPKFYKNKVFIRDSNSNLFVFEKGSNIL